MRVVSHENLKISILDVSLKITNWRSQPHIFCHFLHDIGLSLQWRHNGCNSVSNHQPHHCLLNCYSDTDQRKHQSSASLAFVWGIHRGPVNSPHKWPATRKMFPFDDVITVSERRCSSCSSSLWMNIWFCCHPNSNIVTKFCTWCNIWAVVSGVNGIIIVNVITTKYIFHWIKIMLLNDNSGLILGLCPANANARRRCIGWVKT